MGYFKNTPNFVVFSSIMIKFGILIEFDKYFWMDLADIWLRGQILGADSESEVIYYIRGQYQADIGQFLQFCLQKRDKHSLIIRLLWQQFKSQININLYFWMLHT